jgi:death on curing protein
MAQGDGGQIEWLDQFESMLIQAHDSIVATSGGVYGVHASTLSAAVARPFATFDGEYLYASPCERAAALFHGIICDHAFADGNKRTATVAAFAYLAAFERFIEIEALTAPLPVRLVGEVALETAMSRLSVQDIAFWLDRILTPRTVVAAV